MSNRQNLNTLMGHVRTLENASWSCGTDEYKDVVSDSAVSKAGGTSPTDQNDS